ncbi:transposase [Actinocrinis puniceicyclus]|uniref:Transposase n=1 Tax=Actinocrinis puniceicyclus TaxID=977794 RepID=A0A8J8BEF2_9ACTN|nr:transposase [Actinocrinis puniceicyclus]
MHARITDRGRGIARIGDGWNEHAESRTAHHTGTRETIFSARAGDLELAIPELRTGSYYPAGSSAAAASTRLRTP